MTQWTGKVVGGVLGLLAGGPMGAAVGVILGHQFDSGAGVAYRPSLASADIGDRFFRTTFQVMGHLAKADGRVSEQEIQAARAVMSDFRLTPEQVNVAISCFTQGKAQPFQLEAALDALVRACAGRPELLRVFVEIQMRAALAGNDLALAARTLLQRIAGRLGVTALEFAHIEAVLRIRRGSFAGGSGRGARADEGQMLAQAYRVLEVEPATGDEEIVKAYRRQLSRHHPDKLKANGLPDSMIEHAKQRTQQIIEAYELIRERRGI